jgi:hypothetical protein
MDWEAVVPASKLKSDNGGGKLPGFIIKNAHP